MAPRETRPEPNQAIKRRFILPAVVLIQSCLGGLYAWSGFVPSLKADFGYTAAQTQLVFGMAVTAFTLSMVFAGRLLVPWGPRNVALAGGLLFACGHLTAAASGGALLWICLGSGLLGGMGIGFGYVAALTTAIHWFPARRGLITGISVAGFGAGAIALSSLTSVLLRNGFTILEVFRSVGIGYGALVCLGSGLLFRPPVASVRRRRLPLKGLLRDAVFRTLATGISCGTFAGLLVIGNLACIGIDGGSSSEAATLAIGLFAVGNVLGRLAWGWLSDRD